MLNKNRYVPHGTYISVVEKNMNKLTDPTNKYKAKAMINCYQCAYVSVLQGNLTLVAVLLETSFK